MTSKYYKYSDVIEHLTNNHAYSLISIMAEHAKVCQHRSTRVEYILAAECAGFTAPHLMRVLETTIPSYHIDNKYLIEQPLYQQISLP
jgi:hypothetical protein